MKPMPLAPSTVAAVWNPFRATMRYAKTSGWIAVLLTEGVELPRATKTDHLGKLLTFSEVARLADAAEEVAGHPDDRVLINFLAFTGARIGEASALRVGDLLYTKKRARLATTVTIDRDGTRIIGEAKHGSVREVPLTSSLVSQLEALTKGRGSEEFVFLSKGGSRLDPHNWRPRVFSKAVVVAGLDGKGLTPHSLRHTCASLAIQSGADVLVVARMLGHADVKETLSTYAHLFPDRLDEVAKAMEAALSNALSQDVTDLFVTGEPVSEESVLKKAV
ncbi:site-specific integrase [Rathayibacter sp. VKM Ac-2857]|uniref:tyrosine-type recombinase/integrase n=1 Tax=Rathayibacter sp. VKM Ac-2857 TaxID=2739020 RepID=UPI0020B15B4D|nr:site-specific integrase [Rathayibacter sp. VKM Ac-2857]